VDGTIRANASADRWSYAQHIFLERSHSASLSSQPYAGVAVIFDEAEGGVAVASLGSIQRWQDALISDSAFAKQCSLDPPESFRRVSEPQVRTLPKGAHVFMARP
jgi:hypothetical protein